MHSSNIYDYFLSSAELLGHCYIRSSIHRYRGIYLPSLNKVTINFNFLLDLNPACGHRC